jgi:hypothetical protein
MNFGMRTRVRRLQVVAYIPVINHASLPSGMSELNRRLFEYTVIK